MDRPDFDPDQADSEGWILFGDTHPVSVMALAPSTFWATATGNTFKTRAKSADALALQFVQQKAKEGSAYHIHALAITQLA
jgi:hypothetical protein